MSESVPTDSFEELVRTVAREYGPSPQSALAAPPTERMPEHLSATVDPSTPSTDPTVWLSITR
jgi:hypothetical protein